MRVYHIPRTSSCVIAWSYENRYGPGDVLVNPPEHVVERYGDEFSRLDEDGTVPTPTLEQMPRSVIRRLGSAADGVSGNDPTETIIDAIGTDGPADEADIDHGEESTVGELRALEEAPEPSDEDVERELRDILGENPELEEELET